MIIVSNKFFENSISKLTRLFYEHSNDYIYLSYLLKLISVYESYIDRYVFSSRKRKEFYLLLCDLDYRIKSAMDEMEETLNMFSSNVEVYLEIL